MSNVTVMQLKIRLLTNFQEKPITFDRSQLSTSDEETNKILNTETLNKYPFISLDHQYPDNIFYNLKYFEIMDIIFNENRMISHLSSFSPVNINNIDPDRKNEIIYKNVLITLKSLFPTSFPVIDDVTASINHILNNSTSSFFNYDIGSRIVSNLYYGKAFSYLKNDNNLYTFSKIIYINDILNHPIYFDVLKEYFKYYNYIQEEIFVDDNLTYDNTISALNDNVNTLITNYFTEILQTISDPNKPYLKKFKDGKEFTNTFKNTLIQIFFLKHILSRIYKEYGSTINQFKKKMKLLIDSIKLDQDVKFNVDYLLELYDGKVYYTSKNIKDFEYQIPESFDENSIDTFYAKQKYGDNIVFHPDFEKINDQKYLNGFEEHNIDEIYYLNNNDEIKTLDIKRKNAKMLLTHLSILRTKIFTGTKNLKNITRGITATSIPFYKTELLKLSNKIFNEQFYNFVKSTIILDNKYKIRDAPIENVKREIGNKIQLKKIEKWSYYKSLFKNGERVSTNIYLQKLLLNENLDNIFKDNNKYDYCKKIYQIFPRIYKKFIALQNNNQLGLVDEQCFELSKKCMDVGVSVIKEFNQDSNYSSEYAEIYVISDFINAKIDEKNLKDIKCGYYDKKLGFMINNIVYKDRFSDTNYWDLKSFRNNIMDDDRLDNDIDKKPNEFINNNSDNNLQLPMNQNNNEKTQSYNNSGFKLRSEEKFKQFLVENKEVTNLLNNYNAKMRRQIDDTFLYKHISNKYPEFANLIDKWANNEYYQTIEKQRSLELAFLNVKSNLENEVKKRSKMLEEKFSENLPVEDITRLKISKETYLLYLNILIELEKDSKTQSLSNNNIGGKKIKNKTRTKKNKLNKSRRIKKN